MEYYSYFRNLWKHILPDGTSFCHWGGKEISYKILELLDLKEQEVICDICCGEAGTLSLIEQTMDRVYGIDISDKALKKASKNLRNKGFYLRQADVRQIPFDDCYFDKLFAKDPDIFLYSDKLKIINEISRTLIKGGKFILQTYCSTSNLTLGDKKKTNKILENNGYPYTDVVDINDLIFMFRNSEFEIKFIEDLHEIYSKDNEKMIKNLEKNWLKIKEENIKKLLYWERYLFSKKAWTGVLLVLEKK